MYACVQPHRYMYGKYKNTVANVDASDSRCRCIGKIIARDLRLVVSGLYRMAVTRPRVTCRRYNHAVITQKFWALNEQRQAFARVVRLGQNRVPQTWLLNTGPGGYHNRASDLHQLSGVAQMRVLHGLMS